MGAAIAVLLAERHPDRFDGVATMFGGYDPLGTFNAVRDIAFAVKTLLAPGQDIELVRVTHAERSTQALVRAIEQALTTLQGRAPRLASGGSSRIAARLRGSIRVPGSLATDGPAAEPDGVRGPSRRRWLACHGSRPGRVTAMKGRVGRRRASSPRA
jgi:pimeloyl-ACP methyl ester carboxylesterase